VTAPTLHRRRTAGYCRTHKPCPTTPQVGHAHHRPTRPGRWWAPFALAALPLAALLAHGLHNAGPVVLVLLSTVTP
jgi:hypothetical protein